MPNVINLKQPKKNIQTVKLQPVVLNNLKTFSQKIFWLKRNWYIPAGIMVAIIVIGLSFVLFKKNAEPASAAWFNNEWHYRQQFDVFNASTTEDLIDFQVELPTSTLALSTAWSAGKLRNDFKDLRFTDSAGNLLDYWFPDATSTMMSVYVKMPTMPKNATSTVMMYYGNPSAPDKRDGNKVFPDLFDDFSDGTYAAGPRLWTVTSGTFSVAGTDKYLLNNTAGDISTPSTKAYGVWEFSLYKGNDANSIVTRFINNSSGSYVVNFYSSEVVYFSRYGTPTVDLFTTSPNYLANNTWYRLKVTRTTAGVFTAYIKGGIFGNTNWYEIVENSGSNPTAADTTFTTSTYFLLSIGVGDRMDNILWRKFATTEPRVAVKSGTSEETGTAPVGYWKLDEGYGTTANDSSSYNNDGTLTNMSTIGTSTAWTTGKVKGALQFDGVDDYINVGNVNRTVNSVSFWLNAKSLTKDIIDFDGGTHYLTVSNGTLSATGFTSPSIYVNGKTGTKIQANNWYYITVTTATGFTASNLKLGMQTTYWQGSLDEVKIFNYALSAAQIKTEYNRGVSVMLAGDSQAAAEGLLAWWKMDESTTDWDGAGDRVNDYSGNGNNGTAVGNAAAAVSGKYGNAGTFDGTDDYVTVPSGATLAGKTQATVSAWVYADDFGVTSCVYCEQTSTVGNDRLGLYVDTNAKVNLVYRDSSQDPAGTATTLTGNTALSAATWYYVTGVYDADIDRQVIYINGTEDKKATASVSGLGSSVANAIRIGDLNGSNEWDGYIDDLKVYSIARTPDQIMQDYLTGPGPIASYNFEEKSGLTVNDISGQGNNGTITAGSSKGFVKGKIGRAYDFDGANTKIDTGSDFIGASAATISAWIYLDSYGEGAAGSKRGRIMDNGKLYFTVDDWSSYNLLQFCSNGGDTCVFSDINSILTGQWYHIVVTRSSATTNNTNFYVNGVLSGTPNSSSGTPTAGTTNVIIGNNNAMSTTFDGRIDDLKVYNYILTPWQISQEYNGGKPMAHWSFDEGQGTTAYNTFATSTNALAGTLTNMSTTGTSTAWVTGKMGKGLLFDGSNDTVAVTDTTNSGLDIASAGSMSAWIRPNNVSGNKYIIDKAENTAYALRLTGSALTGYFGNSSCSGGVVKANQWQHVAAAWDGAKIRCYLNGTEVNKTNYSTVLTAQNTSLYIGSDGGAASWFNGLIDEPKVYQYALSPVQIKKDYNDGASALLSLSSEQVQNSQQGLVGWWKMDEATTTWDGTGDRVNDYSGLGNHGTASGDAHATTTAQYGNAAEFDGTDDFITLPAAVTVAGLSKATVNAWVRLRSLAQTSCIYCSQTSTAGNDRLGLYVDTNGKVNFIYRDSSQDPAGTATTITGNTTLSVNTWYFISAVYDAETDKQTIYVNGVQDKQTSNSVSNFGSSAANAIKIGDNNGNNEINGMIDDVKLYNLARTPNQIMQDYLTGPGPIASYNFEEKSGTTVNDISGFGNNGTITAGASQGFVKGKVGRAYDFDGANTKIDTGSNWIGPTGYSNQAISISVWIYADSYGEGGAHDKGYILHNGKTYLHFREDLSMFSFYRDGGITPAFSGTVSNYLGRWVHLVITSTKTSVINFYVNGVLSGTANQDIPGPVAGTTNVILGGNNSQANIFDGRLDDLKVYNYVLTPWQIAQEYNGGGPIGYWKMDEGAPRTVYDWSGNGYNGTLYLKSSATSTAMLSESSCVKGRCLSFDGTDDQVVVNNQTVLKYTGGQMSFSFWAKPGTIVNNEYFISKPWNSSGGYNYQIRRDSSNKFYIYINGATSAQFTSAIPMVNNQWYHLAAVLDGANSRVSLYQNGNLVGGSTHSITSWTPAAPGDQSLQLVLGGLYPYLNGTDYNSDTDLDEVKIFNYALSPLQVREEYNGGFGTYFK